MPLDGSGNLYIDVANLRITYQPASRRDASQDWAGTDVIRVQAYRDDRSQSGASSALHRGAEFPVADEATFIAVIESLCTLYREGRRPTVVVPPTPSARNTPSSTSSGGTSN